MKKVITLSQRFGAAARALRGIRIFAPMVVIAALVAGGCASSPELSSFYQYKEGDGNFYAAKAKCSAKAEAARNSVRWNVNAFILANDKAKAHKSAMLACLAVLGWLPCEEGGQDRPECRR
ncbi:MAG: hypothetical protein ACR2P4_01220 [Gammaproteobacteria bacterium]